MTLAVQRKTCATCIFTDPVWRTGFLKAKLDEIRDPNMPGFFTGWRQCHHSKRAVCAGFWARYKDHFTMGQLAQRLDMVEFVEDDELTDSSDPEEDELFEDE